MTTTGAAALAAAIAAVVEITLLNPITLLRSQAFAGRRGRPQWRYAFTKGWGRGLELQLVSAIIRRAMAFGGHTYLAGLGLNGWLGGTVVGTAEGIAFAPTRRLSFLQQVRRQWQLKHVVRAILAEEGWRGLWVGTGLNTLRMAACGTVYFGTLTTCWRLLPGLPAVVPGALAAAASTTVANPFCLCLSRQWMGKEGLVPWRRWGKGLRIALLRSVPGAALSYGLVHALAGAFRA